MLKHATWVGLCLVVLLACPDRQPAVTLQHPLGPLQVALTDAQANAVVQLDREQSFSMQTSRFGRGVALTPVAWGGALADADTWGRQADGLTERWQRHGTAIEQSWSVAEAPAGTGPVTLELTLEGAVALQTKDAVVLATPRATAIYSGLRVIDADGRELQAHLSGAGQRIAIEFDDARAVYPVTIDPELAPLTLSSPTGPFAFVSAVGDVNNDGYDDAVVGLSDAAKSIFMLWGSPTGLGSAVQIPGIGGTQVVRGGDLTGDRVADFLVNTTIFGTVAVYSWNARIFAFNVTLDATGAAVSASTVQPAGLGDIDGDGVDDYAIGMPSVGTRGNVYIHRSYAGALTTALYPNGANPGFGAMVVAAGDVNNDSYADVLIGESVNFGQMNVYLYFGSPSGLDPSNKVQVATGINVAAMAGLSDVNGDGFSDAVFIEADGGMPQVALGASANAGYSTYLTGPLTSGGGIAVGGGSATGAGGGAAGGGTLGTTGGSGGLGGGGTLVTSNGASAWAAAAGDLNGDGFADLVLSPGGGTARANALRVATGSNNPLLSLLTWSQQSIDLGLDGGSPGASLSGPGDFNGNGFSDAVCTDTKGAAILVLNGFADRVRELPVASTQSTGPGSGASVTGAGDFNCDGLPDYAVGAPTDATGRVTVYFTGSSSSLKLDLQAPAGASGFGAQVLPLGDVTADGCADLGVSALFMGQTVLYVYPGASTNGTPLPASIGLGVGAITRIVRAGDLNGDGLLDFAWVVGNQVGVLLMSPMGATGTLAPAPVNIPFPSAPSLGAGGDFNRDGYNDLLLGWSQNLQAAGEVKLVLGSPSGPDFAGAVSWYPNSIGQPGLVYFGSVVGTVGDVNGDGYSDALIRASNGTISQAVLIYGGPPASNTRSTVLPLVQLPDEGVRVAALGDVNGDGLGDFATAGNVNAQGQQALHLYFGRGTFVLESLQADGGPLGRGAPGFATSVALAGDLNVDGFNDVIVGTPDGSIPDAGSLIYAGGPVSATLSRDLKQSVAGPHTLTPSTRLPVATAVTLSGRASNSLGVPGVAKLQFEVKPMDQAFDGLGTLTSGTQPGAPQSIPSGPVSVLWQGDAGSYHWRARVVAGLETGRWVSFGGNLESDPDFTILPAPLPDGGSDAGRDGGTDAGTDAGADAGTVRDGGSDGGSASTDGGPIDAGTLPDAGGADAGASDAGSPDAGLPDASVGDGGAADAGPDDAGAADASVDDAGAADAAVADGGSIDDAGAVDAGSVDDAGAVDAGSISDAGSVDSGTGDGGVVRDPVTFAACGCQSSGSTPLWFIIGLLMVLRRGRRS